MKSLLVPKRVTVITPTLNSVEFISKALQSAKSQEYENLEHIVVDGGSVDGTLEIVQDCESVQILKQKSTGLYAALNEGLDAATGEFIVFLNSDDILEPNAIGLGIHELLRKPSCDIVKGCAHFFSMDHTGNSQMLGKTQAHLCKNMDVGDLMFGVPIMNARIFRRRVFEKHGKFDSSYSFGADRELLIRLALGGCQELHVDRIFYNYRLHSKSLTLNPERGNAYLIGCDQIRMAHQIIREHNDEMIHKLCRKWIHEAGVTAFAGSIRQWNIVQAIQFFLNQWREEVLWPLIALKIAFGKLIRRENS